MYIVAFYGLLDTTTGLPARDEHPYNDAGLGFGGFDRRPLLVCILD